MGVISRGLPGDDPLVQGFTLRLHRLNLLYSRHAIIDKS